MAGLFVTIEGPRRSGKSTNLAALLEHCTGDCTGDCVVIAPCRERLHLVASKISPHTHSESSLRFRSRVPLGLGRVRFFVDGWESLAESEQERLLFYWRNGSDVFRTLETQEEAQ